MGERLQAAAKCWPKPESWMKDARFIGLLCNGSPWAATGSQALRHVFNSAIKEFPDYQYYYRSRAIYLLPRWNGEDGELERDLEQSADRIGGEAGDMVYAQVVWDVTLWVTTNVFKENNLSWKRADRALKPF